jgi:hypothetical protein
VAQAVLDVGAIVMGPEIAGRLPAAEYTRNQLYALTHEVFVAFDYGDANSTARFTPEEDAYVRGVLPPLVQRLLLEGGDVDIGAELLLCMQYHGVRTAEYWRGLDYFLAAQNPSGAWGRRAPPPAHSRPRHPCAFCIATMSCYRLGSSPCTSRLVSRVVSVL